MLSIYLFIIFIYLLIIGICMCLQWADRLLGFHQSFIFLSPLKFSFNPRHFKTDKEILLNLSMK